MNNVRSLIEDFANQLAALVEAQALDQARAAIESALGVRRPGRPPKAAPLGLTAQLRTEPGRIAGKAARKKPPKQFCPVPGCKNAAAPVFGMVCADHKDVAKAKIKQYRAARKAKKLGTKAPKAKAAKPSAGQPKAAKSGAGKPKAAKAARARTKRPAKPRTQKAAKPRNQKVARSKPAKRQPPKTVAPAPVPVAPPKPPAADAA